jgi:hypothetical protein
VTYTAEDFNQFCHQAAVQFLQTVVVIDNEAIFCETPCDIIHQRDIIQDIVEPSTGVLGGSKTAAQGNVGVIETSPMESTRDEDIDAEIPKELRENILKAAPLINAFADDGVVCSIIRPDLGDEKVVDRAVAVASVADIVVVDWALGKKQGETEGQRAKEIIKGIIEGDLKKRGRLRLIAIYTAEDNPTSILDELYKHIEKLIYSDKLCKNSDKFTIQNRFLKIAVLLKKAAGNHIPNIKPVDFHELPGKLQALFAEQNSGLLPSVTLRAIAAIREGTHHLLAVLHKDLDSALVGHRCLLPHPEDAEEFCEDLVAGEIRSILALAKIGTHFAGLKQNQLWVASRLSDHGKVTFDELEATPDQIANLLSIEGEDRHKLFKTEIKKEWATRVGKNQKKAPIFEPNCIPQFLCGEAKRGIKINQEFARLISFKREAFGLRQPPKNWLPRLTLGTVLQRVKDGKIFLCLQPRCESVRLKNDEKRVFPFLEMAKGKEKECLIINTVSADLTPEEKKLFFESKPKNQAVFEFKSINGNTIIAEKEDNLYLFSADQTKFYWLGDLKDPFAQSIVGKMSDVVGSVGIDPYEWQRRQGN